MRTSLSRFWILCLAGLVAPGSGYVGQWHSYTNKTNITSLAAHQGFVYAGTSGGIRRVEPKTLVETDYDNLDGLLDCHIVGLSEAEDGTLWAVSHAGYVYALQGNRWEPYGQGYAAEGWTMMDRAVLTAGHYLFLGSEKGLTVFDLNLKVSQANLSHFGDQIGDSVLSVIRRADTLYIGTPTGVYKSGMDFSNPIAISPRYGSLFDPNRWTKVLFPQDTIKFTPGVDSLGDTIQIPVPPRQFNFLTFIGDSLVTTGPGMILQQPLRVETVSGSPLRVGSKTFPSDWKYFSTALLTDNRLFVGEAGLLVYSFNPFDSNPAFGGILPPTAFPFDTVTNVAAYGNTVFSQSYYGVEKLDATGRNFEFIPSKVYPSPELFTRFLKNLLVDTNGDAYVGSWGGGIIRIRNGQSRVWKHATDSCLIDVVKDYTVVHTISNLRNSGLFFSIFKSENGTDNQLAYLNTATEKVACLDSTVVGLRPHAIRSFSDSLLGVGSERGVAFYKMRAGVGYPLLTSLGQWTAGGEANETWDLSEDRWGRPWAVIGEQLAFIDTLYDSTGQVRAPIQSPFKPVTGFSGTGCHVLKSDPSKQFWVGCSNGLFHVQPTLGGLGQVDRYGLGDGLLDLFVSDISVNPTNGQVWVATSHGINKIEAASKPNVATLSGVRAYPNPFQPQHRFVLIDNLPNNSTVRLHNEAGNVIRLFRPGEVVGNQVQWDGTNQDGHRVSPGVYLYSVSSGSSVVRGKIVVAR